MHRLSGKAAAFAARPLTLTVASVVVITGLLAAPAPASQAAASAVSHPARHIPARHTPAGRPGPAGPPQLVPGFASDARSDATPAATTGVITGLLRTVTGAPAAGLCVTAAGAAGEAMTRTGADGRYLLSDLHRGRYALAVGSCTGRAGTVPLGTVFSSLPRSVAVTGGLVQTLPTSTALQLGPGVTIDGHRTAAAPKTAQEGAAARNGSISGVVTGNGRKLARICVVALGIRRDQVRRAVTSKSGRYRIGHLGADRYIVFFITGAPECPASRNWLPQFYPDETADFPRKLVTVSVKAGKDTAGIDAALKPGSQISGTVRTRAGKPLRSICVRFTSKSSLDLPGVAIARSGKSGRYVLHSVFRGKYRALFSTGCGNKSNLAAQWWRGADRLGRATRISITRPQHVTGIDASLRPGAIVMGTVRATSGKPVAIPGICVSASYRGPVSFTPRAVTGRDGRFTLTGLSTGTYVFSVNPGCKSAHGANFLAATAKRRITAGRTIRGLNIALRPAAGISGVVTDSHGHGIQGVCVQVFDQRGFVSVGGFAVSGPDGSYSITGDRPAIRAIRFSGGCGNTDSVAPQFYDHRTSGQRPTAVTLIAGRVIGGINAVMQPGGTVAGVVTDAAGHRLPRICAGVAPAGDIEEVGGFADQVLTSRTRRYRISNLAPGAYEVSIGCLFGRFSTQWFPAEPNSALAGLASVTAGHTTLINARLRRAGTITGTVTDTAGKPVPGECVDLADPTNGQFIATVTDGGGTATNRHGDYRITGLTPGRYLVGFSSCDDEPRFAEQWYSRTILKPSATPVTVRSARTTSGIDATLASAGSVTGRVTSPSGKPAGDVCVEALNFAAGDEVENFTNAAGRYTIRGLATARYALTFLPCDGRSNLAQATIPSVAVRAGKVLAKNIRLTPGGSISGTLSAGTQGAGTRGTPATLGTCVLAVPVKFANDFSARFESEHEAETGAGGRFMLRNLPPGAYKIYFNDVLCDFFGSLFGDNNDDVVSPNPFAASWYENRLTEATADKVTVAASKSTSGIDATLPAFGGLTGNVATPAHAAVPGECVTAVPQDTDLDPFFATPPTPETAIAGPEGNYSMIDLQPGRYKVEFSTGCGATGWATQWWAGVSSASQAAVITVKPGKVTAGIGAILHR